ncbi:MFS transporter [Nonomuraea mesophila]|uniref:MFS transporter n=1 Tax=Nonomuraea mesophila TaxID=2530382 RepID=A0A4R5FFW2_9ACTN|nr:MFS transporter [Nonomuraea mesophila]TDE49049.1 MFS transporter [Nonomuraea mesophila]
MTADTSLPPAAGVPRGTWLAFVALLAGAFIALLDSTIVNVALPSIHTGLHSSDAALSWIISGYALAFGLALIPAGRVGDRFGHKWVFLAGLTLFTMASMGCGIAQNNTQLIIARIVQGLAGGTFFTPIIALIQLMFPGPIRGKAFALFGATIGVATALGPLFGGLIVQAFGTDAGWRLIFGVNVPIGVLAVVAGIMLLPVGVKGKAASADLIGFLLVTAGLVALLIPLINGQDAAWTVWSFLSIGASLLFLMLFAAWERRLANRGGVPLVPLRLFRHPAFTGGTVLALAYFAAFTSIFFTISLLWQSGLGRSALATGVALLPFAIGNLVGSANSDRLTGRFGRRVLVTGLALNMVGLIVLWLILATVTATNLTSWKMLAPLLIAGIGCGLFIAPNTDFIVATVDPRESGAASGIIGTMQRVGSAIGIAVVGSVLFGSLDLTASSPESTAHAFGQSAALAMAASAAFSILAFALVFALPKRVGNPW